VAANCLVDGDAKIRGPTALWFELSERAITMGLTEDHYTDSDPLCEAVSYIFRTDAEVERTTMGQNDGQSTSDVARVKKRKRSRLSESCQEEEARKVR
jgi:hypothetical protein